MKKFNFTVLTLMLVFALGFMGCSNPAGPDGGEGGGNGGESNFTFAGTFWSYYETSYGGTEIFFENSYNLIVFDDNTWIITEMRKPEYSPRTYDYYKGTYTSTSNTITLFYTHYSSSPGEIYGLDGFDTLNWTPGDSDHPDGKIGTLGNNNHSLTLIDPLDPYNNVIVFTKQ
jgi:hypothetical protein